MAYGRDAAADQARTRLRPASEMAAVSAFLLVVAFALCQTHCIGVERAIHVPAKAKS